MPSPVSLPRVDDSAPPSLTGSSRKEFPSPTGTMQCFDSLSPLSPHFVSFVWRYQPVRLFSLLQQVRRRPVAWSFRVWQPHEPAKRLETTGSPKFLGNPSVPMPCSPT